MKLDELTRSYPLDPQAVDAAKEFYKKIPSIPRDQDNEIDSDSLEYESDYELANKMKKLGWTQAYVEGYYSNVFINPNESYVLKVNKRQDRPYAWFAFLSRKFPNEHFPKIGNAKVIRVDKEPYRIYAIEKLSPVPDAEDWRVVAKYCKMAVQGKDVLTAMKNNSDIGDQADSLYAACKILRDYNQNYFADIHRRNIMLRGSTIVITDPFSPGA